MARVWIEDRSSQTEYQESMERWKAAKRAGSKRQPPARWRLRWYDATGKPKALSFQKLPDAENKRNELTKSLGDGTYRNPQEGKTPFSEVAEAWFASLRKPGERTKADYRELLDLYVLPKWGTWRISSIKWEDVSAWLTELCNTPGKRGKALSAARISKIHLVLSMVLKYAVRTGKIAASPAVDHELPQDEDDDDHVYLTHKQVAELATAAGEHALLLLVMAYSGIRWGEVSALKVSRVALNTRRLRIVQAYTRKRGGGVLLKDVKNHEKRSVPLLASLVDDLRTLLKGRGRDDLLFPGKDGEAMGYWEFRSGIFDPAVKAAGLGHLGLTPHKLRHTAASLAIAAGADVKVVQQMLGHKSAAMTLDVYGHLFPERLDEVADRLDAGRKAALVLRAVPAA